MAVTFSHSVVEVAACPVSVRRGGRGPTLLYLHGASGAPVVAPFMEALAERFDLIVPEHPGFGASGEPDWLDNIHDLAYFYLDFFEQLDLRDVLLVGTSIGGWLALEIAVRSTERLRALSLVGPSGLYVPGLSRGDIFLWSPEERVRRLFADQSLADRLLAVPPSAEESEAIIKNQYTVARLAWEPRLFDPHLHKWLHRVRVPVQLVWGAQDQVIPAGYAAEFKRLMPQARVDIIDPCGHLPPIECPDAWCALVEDFARR
jgi:pimeloyl-ACP methyl ester carboxylesterase